MSKTISLFVFALVFTVPVFAKDPLNGPIKVFVFTAGADEQGFVDGDLKQRQDSLKDLSMHFSLDKKLFVLVEKDQADIVVEVLGRDMVDNGSTTSTMKKRSGTIFNGPKVKTTNDKQTLVRATFSAGTYIKEIEGRSKPGDFFGWRAAAWEVENQIKTWTEKNYDNLISRRKSN